MPRVSPSCQQNIHPIINYNTISIDKQLHIKTPQSQSEFSPSLNNIQNIEQDYIDLFSHAKKGHMAKYVHMHRPYIYENVFKQDTYYPFKMECELLAQKADQISRSLQNIVQALEIGPGSYSPVMLKTIPLLRPLACQPSFSTYKALDSNLEYAKQACQIVQKQFSTISTEAIEIDFLAEKGFKTTKIISDINGKKLFFYFGQLIFGNNNDEGIVMFLNKIGELLRQGDYLLFGIDTNKNERMLEAAYNTKISHDLLLNTMHHLKNTLNLKNFNPESFDFVYKWNNEKSRVEHYLKPTEKQILKIRDQEFIVNKHNNLNILNSRKLNLEQIRGFLDLVKLEVKEIFTPDNQRENKFSIIITQKNK